MEKVQQRILVKTNDHKLQLKQKAVAAAITAYNEMLELSKDISSNDIATANVNELNEWVSQKTSFANVVKAVELIDRSVQYEAYIALHNDHSKEFKHISIENGLGVVTANETESIIFSFQTYLTDEQAKAFRELQALCKPLEIWRKEHPQVSNIFIKDEQETANNYANQAITENGYINIFFNHWSSYFANKEAQEALLKDREEMRIWKREQEVKKRKELDEIYQEANRTKGL